MITKDELFEQYSIEMNDILDICDWKTHITSNEVCEITYSVLKQNNIKPSIPVESFHTVYLEEINKVWVRDITIREITDIVYDTLLSKNVIE